MTETTPERSPRPDGMNLNSPEATRNLAILLNQNAEKGEEVDAESFVRDVSDLDSIGAFRIPKLKAKVLEWGQNPTLSPKLWEEVEKTRDIKAAKLLGLDQTHADQIAEWQEAFGEKTKDFSKATLSQLEDQASTLTPAQLEQLPAYKLFTLIDYGNLTIQQIINLPGKYTKTNSLTGDLSLLAQQTDHFNQDQVQPYVYPQLPLDAVGALKHIFQSAVDNDPNIMLDEKVDSQILDNYLKRIQEEWNSYNKITGKPVIGGIARIAKSKPAIPLGTVAANIDLFWQAQHAMQLYDYKLNTHYLRQFEDRLAEGDSGNIDWDIVEKSLALDPTPFPLLKEKLDEQKKPRAEQVPPAQAERANPVAVEYDKWITDIFGQNWIELAEGMSGRVLRSQDNPNVVVKIFDKSAFGGRGARNLEFAAERDALLKLQGVEGVVKMLGYYEGGLEGHDPRYIAKEFVEGENIWENSFFPFYPVTKEVGVQREFSEDERNFASWLVSSLETIARIHEKGVKISDFKFSDYLWDPINRRTVIIDFGNSGPESASPAILDTQKIIKEFLSRTSAGSDIGMRQGSPDTDSKWPSFFGGERTVIAMLKSDAEASGVVPSFRKLVGLLADYYAPFSDNKVNHAEQEYIDSLKEFFNETGVTV